MKAKKILNIFADETAKTTFASVPGYSDRELAIAKAFFLGGVVACGARLIDSDVTAASSMVASLEMFEDGSFVEDVIRAREDIEDCDE